MEYKYIKSCDGQDVVKWHTFKGEQAVAEWASGLSHGCHHLVSSVCSLDPTARFP